MDVFEINRYNCDYQKGRKYGSSISEHQLRLQRARE
jgi:hypothetical protein